MKNIKLASGHFADYRKKNGLEYMDIDITDFYLGYGGLEDIEVHTELLTNLKNDGWKNRGIDINMDRYDSIDTVILNVVKF